MVKFKVVKNFSNYLLLFFLLFNAPVLLAQKIVESSERTAGFSFSSDRADAAKPVVHYQQNIHMLSSITDRPSLSIFGDGQVIVHYPVYMKKAGDYEMWLDDAELVNLIRALSSDGIMDFDEKKVKEKVQSYKKTLKAKGQFYEISDAVETIVDIYLDEFQKNKASKKMKNFHKKFKWKNIEHDAARFKHDIDIIKANNSIENLNVLMKDERLLKRQKQ